MITVTGPDFRWRRTFFAPYEQSPLFINEEVRKAVNGKTPKATIIPLHYIDVDLTVENAFPILDSIQVEKIDGLLNASHFKLWETTDFSAKCKVDYIGALWLGPSISIRPFNRANRK